MAPQQSLLKVFNTERYPQVSHTLEQPGAASSPWSRLVTFVERGSLKEGGMKREERRGEERGSPALLFSLLSLEFSHQSFPTEPGLTCQGLLIAPGNIIDLDLLPNPPLPQHYFTPPFSLGCCSQCLCSAASTFLRCPAWTLHRTLRHSVEASTQCLH